MSSLWRDWGKQCSRPYPKHNPIQEEVECVRRDAFYKVIDNWIREERRFREAEKEKAN